MSFFTPQPIPKPFEHQTYTTNRILDDRRILNASDAGTGKTRGTLDALATFCRDNDKTALVLAPKSILQPAWQEDAAKFTPELRTSIAYSANRKKAFETPADIYITNHDAAKWLSKNVEVLQAANVKAVIVDECFPAGTLVDTPSGPTPIESLECGNLVHTTAGPLPISDTMQNPTTHLVELELSDGTRITCTDNHPIATTSGWVEARRTGGMSVVRTGLPSLLQSGLRFTRKALGTRDRRKLSQIAQTLGCQERFLAGTTRVVSVSRIKCPSPRLVYNLQVDGPHNYSVAGTLVHNCTAFKHHTSQRSKALRHVIDQLEPELIVLMTATPNMNNPLDIWHQAYLLDQGERLGKNFYRFRQSVCDVKPNGFANDWVPKEDAHEAIADLLSDITIRFKLEDCTAIPQHSQIKVDLELDELTRKAYDTLKAQAKLELEDGTVTAVNAAVLHNKLLQTCSGAVYDAEHNTATLSTARAEYVTQLVQERDQCVVAFQWKHQLQELTEAFDAAKITYRVIDGRVSDKDRNQAVKDFNNHQAKVILAHPRSAGHGLTLTAGTTTIWPSPISDAELFYQFNRRIYRTGQTKKTQTIVIGGKDCIDQATYDRCVGRIDTQMTTLELLQHHL